jgi:hypothetical protein
MPSLCLFIPSLQKELKECIFEVERIQVTCKLLNRDDDYDSNNNQNKEEGGRRGFG